MRRITATLLALAMVFAGCAAMTGCGEEKPANLQAFVEANPSVEQAISEEISKSDNDVMSSSVDFEENCCIISFKFSETNDEDAVKSLSEAFAGKSEAFEPVCNQTIEELEKATEYQGITVRIRFVNGDDKEIWSKDYSKADNSDETTEE